MLCKNWIFLFGIVLVPASFLQAASISIPNGSFESPGHIFVVPDNWQVEGDVNNSGTGAQTTGMPSASDGSQVAGVRIEGGAVLPHPPLTGAIASAASLGTYTADTVYTLTFDAGGEGGWWGVWEGDARALSSGLGIFNGAGLAATPVVIDTTDLQEPAPTGGESYVLLPGAIVEGGDSYSGWKRFTVTLDTAVTTSVVGQDISVIMGWTHNHQFAREITFDNVTLDAATAAIPEPTSLLLLSSMGVLIFSNRRVRG